MHISSFYPSEISENFVSLLLQLRPHLSNEKSVKDAFLQLSNSTFLVAKENDDFQGFISFQFSYNLYLGNFCLVDDLIVSESFRGLGIGKKLMEAVEKICKEHNISTIKLDSGLQRLSAHAFYEKLNFQKKCYTFEKISNLNF